MTSGFVTPPGATPLDADALAGLIPHLTTQTQLNEFEEANIVEAREWAMASRVMKSEFPTPDKLRELHRRMFDKTWRWAAQYRKRDTNIGIDWSQIAVSVRDLCDDVTLRLTLDDVDGDELSASFHHRLVAIHPFTNGNGRHGRLATDILRRNCDWPSWHWGSAALDAPGDVRDGYIAALRAADSGDLRPLIAFAQ